MDKRNKKRVERRGIRETRKKEGGEKKEQEVIFWNVADLSNKDKEFLEKLNTWKVLVLMET